MAEEKKPEQQGEKKKLNTKVILMAAFGVVNLGLTGAGAALVYLSTIGYHPPSLTEAQLEKERKEFEKLMAGNDSENGPLIFTMEKITANLNGEPKRSIQIEVNLEMLSKEGFEEVIDNENRPKAKDRILRILSDQSFAQLESIQGKLFLKDRIATELNGLLKKGVVKDVYFTEFVVQ